ncbi:hypothetical protein B0H11DRAFT_2078307 [Mycena galericulata]|nr:hypothetical protein B0H11DRAFT_2078307 [Mycena galericulata]
MLAPLRYVAALGVVFLSRTQMASGSTATGALAPRQSSLLNPSQIPPQCENNCTTIVSDANTCTTFQCLCSPKNDAAVLSCVNCVISFNHSGPVIINGQDILNQYASECNLNNISISSLSASGAATVTGLTTSNLNPSPSFATTSQTSQSASATSPHPSLTTTSSFPTSSGTPSGALPVRPRTNSLLWPSYATVVIMVTLTVF